jgi:hypothetical protein
VNYTPICRRVPYKAVNLQCEGAPKLGLPAMRCWYGGGFSAVAMMSISRPNLGVVNSGRGNSALALGQLSGEW